MSVGIAFDILNVLGVVGPLIGHIIGNDNGKREAFTKGFVEHASQLYPNYNVVVVHVTHRVEGDYTHQHYELPMTVGTCGYEIYFSQMGRPFTFVLEGDGGFINWAFSGEFTRNGGTLTAAVHA